MSKIHNAIIKMRGSIKKSLSNVLILKLRILLSQFITIWIKGCQFHNTPDG